MKRRSSLIVLSSLVTAAVGLSLTRAQTSNPESDLLKSPEAKIRARAAHDLGKQGDTSAIPALAAVIRDPNESVRREVVIALAQMHSPAALDPLISATKDLNDDIRILAIQSLTGYYTGNLPTSGFTGFMKKSWERAKGHFTVDNTRIDPGLPVEPQVVSALDEALRNTASARASQEAAKSLGILVAQAAVPDLVHTAHSSDPDLACESLNALSKIKQRSAGPQLVDLLDSPNKDIKHNAAVTVGLLHTVEGLAKLQAIFESDPDLKDKENALEGLAYLGQQVSVPLFTKALWNADKNIRVSAGEGLARAADPKTLLELEKAVAAEKDANARLAFEFGITALGKDDYIGGLVNELGSKVRGDVAQPYLIELTRNRRFLPKVYPYLQSPQAQVRKRLCTVLMFSGDQSSLEPLDRLSHDPDGDVSAEALRAKRAIRARLDASAAAAAPKGP
jgi:HEAT repeat protein